MFGSLLMRSVFSETDATVSVPTSYLRFYSPSSTRSSGAFTAASDLGSGAGSFTAVNTVIDSVHFSDLAHIPVLVGTARFAHNAAASTWNFLINSGGTATLSFRFYIRTVTANGVLLCTCQGGSSTRGILVWVSTNKIAVNVCNGSTVQTVCISPTTLTTGWHTVVVTKSGANITLYFDNDAPVHGTITSPTANNTTDPIQIGGTTFGSAANSIMGYVGDVRIWQSVLSSLQISALKSQLSASWYSAPGIRLWLDADHGITLTSGEVSAWADRAIGNDVTDGGTSTRRPSVVSSWRNGKNALQFDGTTDALSRATLLNGDLAQPSAVYHVGEFPSVWKFSARLSASSTITAGQRNDEFMQTSDRLTAYAGTDLTTPTMTAPTNKAFVTYAHYNAGSSGIGAYLSDGASYSNTGAAGSGFRRGITIGALSSLASADCWSGKIAAILLIDHIPSTAEHNAIIVALRNAYNI